MRLQIVLCKLYMLLIGHVLKRGTDLNYTSKCVYTQVLLIQMSCNLEFCEIYKLKYIDNKPSISLLESILIYDLTSVYPTKTVIFE